MQKTSIPYWPASPSNGYVVDDSSRGLFVQRWGSSQDPNYGDIHRSVQSIPKCSLSTNSMFTSCCAFYIPIVCVYIINRYDYTDPCTDVSYFPTPRFASEFGLQSYPSTASWLEVSDPSVSLHEYWSLYVHMCLCHAEVRMYCYCNYLYSC